jgi:hypothetical protein
MEANDTVANQNRNVPTKNNGSTREIEIRLEGVKKKKLPKKIEIKSALAKVRFVR